MTGLNVFVSKRMYNRMKREVEDSNRYNSISDYVRKAIYEKMNKEGNLKFIDSKPVIRRVPSLTFTKLKKLYDQPNKLLATKDISNKLNTRNNTVYIALSRLEKKGKVFKVIRPMTRTVKNRYGGEMLRTRNESLWGIK